MTTALGPMQQDQRSLPCFGWVRYFEFRSTMRMSRVRKMDLHPCQSSQDCQATTRIIHKSLGLLSDRLIQSLPPVHVRRRSCYPSATTVPPGGDLGDEERARSAAG
jgi:hypothetical protein